MLSPKQKKIAAKAGNPNKIDAKDFEVLRAEKAKGRGMGLEDEKLKPGKEYTEMMGGGMIREPMGYRTGGGVRGGRKEIKGLRPPKLF